MAPHWEHFSQYLSNVTYVAYLEQIRVKSLADNNLNHFPGQPDVSDRSLSKLRELHKTVTVHAELCLF